MKKKIIYAGTPDFAVPALQSLIDGQSGDYEVVAVYSQPDRPAGRGRKLQASPVKQCALDANIPVYQPLNFKEAEDRQILQDLQPDLIVVAAYGLLLPEPVLSIPTHGCINLHASILPRWRGAAPIQRAIEAGDAETGVTLMKMDIGLDTGDMLAVSATAISGAETGQTLHDRLANIGGPLLMQHLPALLSGELAGNKQDNARANYAKKLSKAEAELDFNSPTSSALALSRKIRAMTPWPICYTQRNGKPLRFWMAEVAEGHSDAQPGTVISCTKQGLDIATAEGILRITKLQLPGGKPLAIQDFVNAHDLTGELLIQGAD